MLSKGRSNDVMKTRSWILLILTAVLICLCTMAQCESTAGIEIIPDEEWSWSRGAYNTFTGRIDLSGCNGEELYMMITADLPYDPDTEKQSMPVFTSVNGKRIVMTKQSDTVRLDMETGNTAAEFAVSFRLPEKKRVQSVVFTFRITDSEGNELRTASGQIDNGKEAGGGNGNQFYINADIRTLTLVIAGAALLIWTLVLARHFRINKQKKTGE